MNRVQVRSSNICTVGYDQGTKTLELEFHSGAVYKYSGVTETVYQGFMDAASKGTYFHDHIRDRYPCTRVG